MKNPLIAYILWLFFGWLGAHRIYLGKIPSGIAMLVLFFLGIKTMVFLIGFLFLAIWIPWWIYDVYYTGAAVDEYNANYKNPIKEEQNAFVLTKLGELAEKGIITSEEFERKKAQILHQAWQA